MLLILEHSLRATALPESCFIYLLSCSRVNSEGYTSEDTGEKLPCSKPSVFLCFSSPCLTFLLDQKPMGSAAHPHPHCPPQTPNSTCPLIHYLDLSCLSLYLCLCYITIHAD